MRAFFVFYRPFFFCFLQISCRNAYIVSAGLLVYRESAMVMAVVGPCMMNAS
jgi:hypothetical protein